MANQGEGGMTVPEMLAQDPDSVYRGAPNSGAAGGPAVSPQLAAALAQSGGF